MSREHPCRADPASWIISREWHWVLYLELGALLCSSLGHVAELSPKERP